jgi:hypothetical protein
VAEVPHCISMANWLATLHVSMDSTHSRVSSEMKKYVMLKLKRKHVLGASEISREPEREKESLRVFVGEQARKKRGFLAML